MPPKQDSNRIDELLASVTDDMLGGVDFNTEDNAVRVESILMEMVRPDPIQPRRVLPEQIHIAFHSHEMTPTQALRELVALVQVSARQQGRPFHNVLELLPQTDKNEDDQEPELSPEEILLRDLVNLAVTIRDDGQVNPITVVDVSQGVTRMYRIETGERRYWASWILRDFIPNYQGDGMLPCIIIPAERSTIFRQAKENTARKGLTSIAMARQAALLLLTVHGYPLPDHVVNNDFYRQALDLDLRGKREFTEAILNAMGGINKGRFRQFKALLQLSDEALELADRHSLDEFQLRPILQLPPEAQYEMIQHVIQFNLSGRQIRDICENGFEEKDVEEISTTPSHIQRFVKTMQKLTDIDEEDFIHGLLLEEKSSAVALARLENTISLLMRVKNRISNA